MAKLFSKGVAQPPANSRQLKENTYQSSRTNLLLVVAFSVINVVLLATGGESYFLFSAYIPYAVVTLGMWLCGKFPTEWYGEEWADTPFLDNSFFVIMLIVAAVLIALYLLAWIFSKKRVGWLIFALVFFAVDTGAMLLMQGISMDGILDIVFHAWVIISLVGGIRAHAELKKFPEELVELQQQEAQPPVVTEPTLNSEVNTDYKLN